MRRLWQGIAERLGRLTGRRTTVPAPPPAVPKAKAGGSARTTTTPTRTPRPTPARPAAPTAKPAPGRHRLAYSPQVDGRADPGEIVWTWVAYEEDPNQGKDRPVLVVGRQGSMLEGLMLSSNSERDGQRHWFALGPGSWDRDQRPSWVRLDRVLTVTEDGIRREGAVLDKRRFDAIAAQLRRSYGWS